MEAAGAAGKVGFRVQVQRLALDRRKDTSSVSPQILIVHLCLPVTKLARYLLHHKRKGGRKGGYVSVLYIC